MHEFPPASVHVRRHLTTRERATIAAALVFLAAADDVDVGDAEIARYIGDDGLLSNDAMAALADELTAARKVKLCRSKTSSK